MKKILSLPLCDEDVSYLKAGDIVYLSGLLITGRDEVYRRVTEEKIALPVDLRGMVNYHAGPIVRKKENKWELVSIGPTSSVRMEKWAADFIERTGVKVMIGKGGMGEKTVSACRKYKAIHCVYPGGCAVLGASQIEKIENVFWQELGMAECLWVMKSCEFGPLIVSIDTHGNSLFAENSAYYEERKIEILSDFSLFS
ncbi:MAG: L(+)-tartrate dehydratase subunit beta [Treponema sp.]|jgi:L(+)-tartrate dehydratase beta subunit|nr:L(+)-tartrate dehydratase subunit beta [Treponema sp.]